MLLSAGGPSNVAVERLEDGRIRVSTVYRGGSLDSSTRAVIKLASAAEKLCGGRGRAVSEGALIIDNVPREDRAARKRGDVRLSETYRCLERPPKH
jgi:hypothetical protein